MRRSVLRRSDRSALPPAGLLPRAPGGDDVLLGTKLITEAEMEAMIAEKTGAPAAG